MGLLPCNGGVVRVGDAAATKAGLETGGVETGGVETGGPEAGARFGAVPVTLAGFMTWAGERVSGEGAVAANPDVETGGVEDSGLEAGARLDVAPVTLAGFITMVSRPEAGARTGVGGGT